MKNFVINNLIILQEKVNLIQSLIDIEIAHKILEENVKDEEHPCDSHYKKLNCKLRHIKKIEDTYSLLNEYLTNTTSDYAYQKINLLEAFEIERPGEHEKFKEHLGNKMLLWHGSRITNFVGILSQGLRIAPPEAPSTGYLFGKGIYFADMAAKSACYCYPSNGIALILLCEVALGNPNELCNFDYNAANLPSDKHSTKGCGMTIPSDFKTTKDGVIVPCGKPTKNTNKVF